ncbi:hypothetical protein XthCFBP4691_12470 [Xanthomonas theicola]|uniref:Lipoprotein n=1 Tax=Xanthomonas theicola TaxID=56464 RepID=A0A2S6ZE42_9XANT|nr:hypothetical protein XthCFBP4691_12470 [Xanthomonas theicola]
MKKTAPRPRPSLLLLLLACVTAASSCATTSPPAAPAYCPKASPAPSNVMRTPNYEQRLRELLFKSGETPTTKSTPPKP